MPTSQLSLSPGDHLGRYEILAIIGAGGMGEVYRARDPELHRDVAVKVLRKSAADATDVARFAREARAAGGLNHPNIVAVFDAGVENGVPYVVTELLEGETLRQRLDRGAIPFLKVIDYGVQIAEALGAAHARGIWHRDVKPANAFVTSDGRVKLLDFGIAKLAERHVQAGENDPTQELSHQHSVIGTAGYMSPEQVRGLPTDHRTDIFALGAVLYEMFSRTRAFKRDSAVQTMNAVLEEDPVDLLAIKPDLPPMAVAIVRRCLEKNKEERFQSARDLAFDLQQLRDVSAISRTLPAPPIVLRRNALRAIASVALLLGAVAAGWMLAGTPTQPVYEQLTFGRVRINSARFVSGGQSVIYSESSEGNPLSLWRLGLRLNNSTGEWALESTPTRPEDYPPGTDILSARADDLTLLVNREFVIGERWFGTLATAPLGGGNPRPSLENVEDADWDPSGENLAVVRYGGIGGKSWLEYPEGNRLYETTGSIRFPRVSPGRDFVAFVENEVASGEGGHITVVKVDDHTPNVLTDNWRSVRGMDWSSDGREIWISAGTSLSTRALLGVNVKKREEPRVVLRVPGSLTLWDIARDGRVLISRDDERRSVVGMTKSDAVERELDLSRFDDSGLADVSDDGMQLLFSDRFGVYLHEIGTPNSTRLGTIDAYADDLSKDGQNVIATRRLGTGLLILRTGAGDEQKVPAHGIISYRGARWFPDGKRILFSGHEEGRPLRSYVQQLTDEPPMPLTPEGFWALAISADGAWAAVIRDPGESGLANEEYGVSLWPIDGKSPEQRVKESRDGDRPVAFSDDGKWLWAYRRGEVPAPLIRFDLATGSRDVVKQLQPADVTGVDSITEVAITPDGRAYFYSYRRLLSQLYLVTGLR